MRLMPFFVYSILARPGEVIEGESMNMVIASNSVKAIFLRNHLTGKACWVVQRRTVFEGIFFNIEYVTIFGINVD